jgi:glycosyltransferase involved in cell wall biosynthesis
MKLTYISERDFFDRDYGSGTDFWIPTCLKNAGIDVEVIHVPISQKLLSPWQELGARCKQFFSRMSKKGYFTPGYQLSRAHHVADTLNNIIAKLDSDVILTALSPISVAFVQTKQPIVFWTDYLYTACANFYPDHRFHHVDSRWDGHDVTDACLMNSKLLIFSSQWCARAAVELHGIAPEKIHVVPFGPNLSIDHHDNELKSWITQRKQRPIKLLFVGKQWFRKGGDIVLTVANRLNELNHETTITLVGSKPFKSTLPPYVTHIDFVSKNSPEDIVRLKKLYQDSHFLFVPSRAETFGIVFCEASAFGLPSISSFVGGISDVVKNGVNGMTFSLEDPVEKICHYILATLDDPLAYQALCLSSYNEYKTRLNWDFAGQQVKKIIESNVKFSANDD